MPQPVVNGAVTMCSFGLAPSTLVVPPINRVMIENQPAANIMDNKPYMNIVPFGLCTSLANPITAAQTSAALGVLTPGACTPMPVAPWILGAPTDLIANIPALTNNSTCNCAFGGVINITMPVAVRTSVG